MALVTLAFLGAELFSSRVRQNEELLQVARRSYSRKDLVLWPQRAFACVPMSWVDTFYRTEHWPRRAVLAGPFTAHSGDCMHICVSGVLKGHDVTGGPNPAACSTVP